MNPSRRRSAPPPASPSPSCSTLRSCRRGYRDVLRTRVPVATGCRHPGWTGEAVAVGCRHLDWRGALVAIKCRDIPRTGGPVPRRTRDRGGRGRRSIVSHGPMLKARGMRGEACGSCVAATPLAPRTWLG
ncbi:Hypothetical protein A7982_02574 [Minicystis rosea]|nr:Hypothetical protein A7982_02574 [Minicystis rosea]